MSSRWGHPGLKALGKPGFSAPAPDVVSQDRQLEIRVPPLLVGPLARRGVQFPMSGCGVQSPGKGQGASQASAREGETGSG